MIDLKAEPELRHVLAHLIGAIEALKEGCPRKAQMEIDSIAELVFFADDDPHLIEAELKARGYGQEDPDEPSTVSQGQEEEKEDEDPTQEGEVEEPLQQEAVA